MGDSRTLAILLVGFAIVGCGGSGPEDSPQSRIRWTFQAPAPFYYASAALSADQGTVYIGSSNPHFGVYDQDLFFYALSAADGAVRWSLPLGQREVRSAPAVAPDGSIWFLVQGRDPSGVLPLRDDLLQVRPGGSLAWTYTVNTAPTGPETGLSAPAIAPDGTVYVASSGLYAVRPFGEIVWERTWPIGEDLRNSPVVGSDGTVYFAFHNIPLTALDPTDGSTLWTCDLGVNDYVFASPALTADGTILVAANHGLLYAVSPQGAIRWTFDLASTGYTGTFRSSPAVAADGTIYLGTNEGYPAPVLLALHGDGTLKWIFEPGDLPAEVPASHFDIYSSPAIGSDGTVYFGQEFGRIYAVRPADGTLLWMVPTRQGITWSSPALAADGTLFIGDLSGRVYAVQTESSGLEPGASWPKYRRDAGNTGCLVH